MKIGRTAWRNVWRNKRRSIVTIAAMTLALFVLVLYSGLVEGYLRGMERNVIDLEMGDIQIYAHGYLDLPSKYTLIDDPSAVLAELDAAGFPASARILTGGLAGSEDSSAGVSLRGIDVERDARVLRIASAVADGQWLDPNDSNGVVIGRRLARTLGIGPGDELVVLTQAMDGGIADNLYIVRGVLQGIADATDRSAVFMLENTLRELILLQSGAHQIIVRRPAELDIDAAAQQVRDLVPDLDVRTWRQMLPTIAQMLDSSRGMVVFIFLIIYLAVGILILNAMLMAVFERIREFGVLKAIGGGPVRVLLLILTESLIQIIVATAIGLGLAIPCMHYLTDHGIDAGSMAGISIAGVAMEPIWYGVYTTQTVVAPVVMLFVIALLAALYPAVKAARIRPVEAMRYQ